MPSTTEIGYKGVNIEIFQALDILLMKVLLPSTVCAGGIPIDRGPIARGGIRWFPPSTVWRMSRLRRLYSGHALSSAW